MKIGLLIFAFSLVVLLLAYFVLEIVGSRIAKARESESEETGLVGIIASILGVTLFFL